MKKKKAPVKHRYVPEDTKPYDPTVLKVSAFADDVTIVQPTVKDMKKAGDIVRSCCRASGSHLNPTKLKS
jgi:hypothetical protein